MTNEKLTKHGLARKYAGLGWKVFPIRPGTKDRPMCKWGTEATSDPAIIDRWWTNEPEANIGVATGPSGLAVIDLDNKKGKSGSKEWENLEFDHGLAPDTLRARTPSGGEHLYFRGLVSNSVDKLASGVDTRGSGGHGGYVLAPGSTLPGGSYEVTNDAAVAELPEWIPNLVGAARTKVRDEEVTIELDRPEQIAWARQFLAYDAPIAVEGQGGDNATFKVACRLRDRGLSEETIGDLLIEHYNERCEPPWTDEELRTKAANAMNHAGNKLGADTAEMQFDEEVAGPIPSIEEFAEFGARPFVEGTREERTRERMDRPVRGFLDEWVWISKSYLFLRRSDKFELSPPSFDSKYGHMDEKGKPSAQIFKNDGMMMKFMSVEFLPGEGEYLGEKYNTWTRPRLKPVEGDPSPFYEHMATMFPDDKERGYALDWMAWVLQNQTRKPNFMLLIQGRQGTGKSWIGRLMEMMVDPANTTQLRTEDVSSRFNNWLKTTRLGVIEELMGDDRRTLANRLKALITQDMVTVEQKGKDQLTMPNRVAFMAFTNHLDALRLEDEDRRYLVLRTSNDGAGTSDAYWNRLWSFIASDAGPAAVMHDLLARQVPIQFGLGRAPITKAHSQMRIEGLPELERWLHEQFELRNGPFAHDLIAVSDVETFMTDRLRKSTNIAKTVHAFLRDVAKAEDLGAVRLNSSRNAQRRRILALRRAELYRQMGPAGCAKRYLEQGNSNVGGNADAEADSLTDPLA